MKKIFLVIILFFVSFSCDDILETTRVVIIVPANIAKLHIGVYDSSISEKTFITKEVFSPAEQVAMDVPSGSNRMFLVVAEGFDGYAIRLGTTSNPVDLKAGSNTTIDITVNLLSSLWSFSFYSPPTGWTKLTGAINYKLYKSEFGFSQNNFLLIYEGASNEYPIFEYSYYYYVLAYFPGLNVVAKLGPNPA